MHKIPHLLKKIPKSTTEIIFFGMIFTIYFMSAVGIMNTFDGAQYFTTKVFLEKGNINLVSALKYKHFFSLNDVYHGKNEILPVRGYMHIALTAPIHFLSDKLTPYIKVNKFPKKVASDSNFAHELVTTAFFAYIPVLGLFFFYLSIKKILPLIYSFWLTIFVAFGTYIWKYSTSYTRQGILVLIFGALIYSLSIYLKKGKSNKFGLIIFTIVYGYLFGVDLVALLSVKIGAIVMLLYIIYKKDWSILPSWKYVAVMAILLTSIIAPQIYLNMHWLNSITYQKYDVFYKQTGLPPDKVQMLMASNPIFPTIWWILFGTSKLPIEIFMKYWNLYPVPLQSTTLYATKYNFFGLFSISPFILLGSIPLVQHILSNTKHKLAHSTDISFSDKEKYIGIFCFTTSAIFILIMTKMLGFYAATSYDLRYFFPIVIPLSYICALGMKFFVVNKKIAFKLTFFTLGTFSIIMGAIGIMNAYGPYMTLERRIWIEIGTLHNIFSIPREEILNAIIPNRENALLPLVLILVILVINKLIRMIGVVRHSNK